MNGRNVVRFALVAALALAVIPGAAMAQYPSNGKWWNPQETQDQQFHRGDFEGRWVAQDRYDSNGRRGFGFGMLALPNYLNIDQGPRAVRIADRQNNLVQVIAIADGARNFRNQATFLRGRIHGTNLVAYGTDSRGRQMKQTIQLRGRGNTLVVRTQIESRWGRTMTFEKVYERA